MLFPGEAVQREEVGPGGAAAASERRSAEDPRDGRPGRGSAEVTVHQTQRTRREEQHGQRQTQADGE